MKKFKFIAFVMAFVCALAVSLFAADDDNQHGVPSFDCNGTPETLNEGTCYPNGSGTQCTLSISSVDAWSVASCNQPMRINPPSH